MSKNKVSVKGLQNIGAILGRNDAPQPEPNRERMDIHGIFKITQEKLMAAIPPMVASDHVKHKALFQHYLKAGLHEAYNLGHAHALEQNSQVDKMLDKQYEARTAVLTPTVVCAIMEQSGLSSMTLNLALMATVFDRCDVQYTLDADTNIMTYNMRPIGEHGEGAFTHPQEIADELEAGLEFDHATEIEADRAPYYDKRADLPPTDPRTKAFHKKVETIKQNMRIAEARNKVEADIRHQVEDIEQTAGPINVDAEQFEAKDYGYDGPNSSEHEEDKQ